VSRHVPSQAEVANFASRPLSRAEMDALAPGAHVIDASNDISTRRADGLWQGYEMAPIPTAKLHKYGPIRLWTGVL
jgi:hypothetical protein